MAKTIIIDTEVRGVEEASEQIDGLDSKVDDLSGKKISIGLDSEKLKKQTEELQKTGDQISKLGEGIAGAFTLANGVVGTMGASIGFTSEEIQNAQEKSAAFLGIMQSMKPVTEGVGVAFNILGKILKTNPLILLATIIGGIIVSFLDFGKIIDGIKIGFQAVGDAAKVVWDGIVDGVKFAIDIYTQSLDLLTFGLFDLNGAYRGFIDNIEEANEAERKRIAGLKEEEKQINKNIEQITKQISAVRESFKAVEEKQALVTKMYDAEIRLLRAAGKDTEQAEGRKLEAVREAIKEKIKLKVQEFELEQRLIEEQAKRAENVAKQGSNLVAIGNKQFTEDLKKRSKETNDFIKSLNDELFENQLQIDEKLLAQQKEAYDKRKALDDAEYERRKRLAEEEQEWLLSKQQQAKEEYLRISKEKKDEEIEINFDALEENVKISEEQSLKEATDLATRNEKQRELNQLRIEAALSTLQTLANLTQLFAGKSEEQQKKAFKVQKAINIASAVIDTYKAANAALASAPPPFNFIAAAATVTAGLLNVKTIAQTEFNSGSSGAGGGASAGGGFGSPSLPSVDTSSVAFQFPNAPSDNDPQPSRVYVVESDIANTQRRVNVAEANATFG